MKTYIYGIAIILAALFGTQVVSAQEATEVQPAPTSAEIRAKIEERRAETEKKRNEYKKEFEQKKIELQDKRVEVKKEVELKRMEVKEFASSTRMEVKEKREEMRKNASSTRAELSAEKKAQAAAKLKERIAKTSEQLNKAVDRLNESANKVSARLDSFAEKGVDVTAARTGLEAARAKIVSADSAADAVAQVPASSDDPRASLESLKTATDNARKVIREAHEAIVMVIKNLKPAVGTATTTSTQ